jgi:hypothetical protein
MMPFGLTGAKLIVGLVALAALAAIVFGLYKSIYNSGYAAGYAKLTEYVKKQGEATRVTERVVEKVVTEVQTVYVDRVKIVKEKGRDTIVKVPVYITKVDDAACELRNGWVRTVDAAARNDSPGPAADTDRDPAGVALSEATAAIVENYTQYHVCREKVIGWNEFWSKYKSAVIAAGCVPSNK